MDISQYLEKYPQLEELCRSQIASIYKELLGLEPLPEVYDYIMIGVRNNPTRPELMLDLKSLFVEKTEQLVKWLFEVFAPLIRLEAQKLDRMQKSHDSKTPSAQGGDLVADFEEPDSEFDNHKKQRRQDRRDFQGMNHNGRDSRYNDNKLNKYGQKRNFD